MLYDNHGRAINYLRLAVTDRCNLRCFYCMPEEGIDYINKKELLTYEEMERLVALFASLGISKLRITGGEPFVRKGMMEFLGRLSKINKLEQIHITTNGTLTEPLIPELKAIGISSVNLSLDTLDKNRFFDITRRDSFDTVMGTFHKLLEYDIPTKINTVVMDGKNIEDIIPMIELTREHPVAVRFIEEMPFNGGDGAVEPSGMKWNINALLTYIRGHYPELVKLKDPDYSTSANYQVPGYKGSVGIIAAYSRLFCGTCNRIRITPQGSLKTCLYDDGVFNIKDLIRSGADDNQLKDALVNALGKREKDGFAAEKNRLANPVVSESMSTIGG